MYGPFWDPSGKIGVTGESTDRSGRVSIAEPTPIAEKTTEEHGDQN